MGQKCLPVVTGGTFHSPRQTSPELLPGPAQGRELGSREGRPRNPALRKEVRASLYSTGPQESNSWAPPGHPSEGRREQPQGAWGQWSTSSLCLPRISPISLLLFSPGASLCRRPFLAPLPLPPGPSASSPGGPCLARTPCSSQSPWWPQLYPPLLLSSQGLAWGQWLPKRRYDRRRGHRITVSNGRETAGPQPGRHLNVTPGPHQRQQGCGSNLTVYLRGASLSLWTGDSHRGQGRNLGPT